MFVSAVPDNILTNIFFIYYRFVFIPVEEPLPVQICRASPPSADLLPLCGTGSLKKRGEIQFNNENKKIYSMFS
jgi:hypothetical protein